MRCDTGFTMLNPAYQNPDRRGRPALSRALARGHAYVCAGARPADSEKWSPYLQAARARRPLRLRLPRGHRRGARRLGRGRPSRGRWREGKLMSARVRATGTKLPAQGRRLCTDNRPPILGPGWLDPKLTPVGRARQVRCPNVGYTSGTVTLDHFGPLSARTPICTHFSQMRSVFAS